MLSRVVGLSASGLLGLRAKTSFEDRTLASKWPMAFQHFRNQPVGCNFNSHQTYDLFQATVVKAGATHVAKSVNGTGCNCG